MREILPEGLIEIADYAKNPVYIVGGFCRNYFLELPYTEIDIDICGADSIDAFRANKNFSVYPVNKKLGTFVIKYKDIKYEYTPLRSETYGGGGAHRPESVVFHNDLEADAKRRDFTCNSIYFDIRNNEFIDFLDGITDIKNKILRASNPEFTFSSDGLRVLRAVRLAAELGFSIDAATGREIRCKAQLLSDISAERKRIEFEKILHADSKYCNQYAHYNGLKLMQELNIFEHFIPEIKMMEGVTQNPKYHKFDVMEHVFQTVKYSRSDIRRAALFHDIGKPESLDAEGHMKGHNIISEQMCRQIMGRNGLKYPNGEIEETARLCRLHMYDLRGDTSIAKMRLFIAENFDIIDKVAALREADSMATGYRDVNKTNRFMRICREMINEGTPVCIKQLKIDGHTLTTLGVPSKSRSALLKGLLRECIINPKLNNEEWLMARARKFAETGEYGNISDQ